MNFKKKLLLPVLGCVVLLGYWFGKEPAPKQPTFFFEKALLIAEYQPFAIVVYASNDALWCQRALRSIFEQDYETYRVVFIDDASADGTLTIAQEFVLENNQDGRVILMRNEVPLGLAASLERAIDTVRGEEIVIPLVAKDWLALPTALREYNRVYQDPDVWMTAAPSIEYPSYEKSDRDIVYSFYAALYREGHARDLQALRALVGERVLCCDQPLFFVNRSVAR